MKWYLAKALAHLACRLKSFFVVMKYSKAL
jgi:hypothetical protein